jgi:hypothetical protein
MLGYFRQTSGVCPHGRFGHWDLRCFESIDVILIDQINPLSQSFWIKMDRPDEIVSGRQIAAARTLAGLGQAELANRSSISVPTLKRMEASIGPAVGLANNVAAVRRALESAGVEFIAENGGGPGVRLTKGAMVALPPAAGSG